MFTFSTIAYEDNILHQRLELNNERIGVIEQSNDGFDIKSNHKFTFSELSLLISQLAIKNPELLSEHVAFSKEN